MDRTFVVEFTIPDFLSVMNKVSKIFLPLAVKATISIIISNIIRSWIQSKLKNQTKLKNQKLS
jgi:hypothetical protein